MHKLHRAATPLIKKKVLEPNCATHMLNWTTGLPSASYSVTAFIATIGARAAIGSAATGAAAETTRLCIMREPAAGEKAEAPTTKRARTSLNMFIFT